VRKGTGVASTIFNAQRQVGGAIGVALLTAVISALHPGADNRGLRRGQLAPFHLGLLVCAGDTLDAAGARANSPDS
jgi:hypothetical protein